MGAKTCQICGKNSGMYPLCKSHLEMKSKGLVIKNEKTGNWELSHQQNVNEGNIEFENQNEICCVCGASAPQGKQCKDCYYETLDYKGNIDKNRKASELREWYYNLKNSIYRQTNISLKQSYCNKLIALAILNRDVHNDDSLISRVYKDIEILLKENKTFSEENSKNQTEFDIQKNESSGQVKCIDGHWVENDLER